MTEFSHIDDDGEVTMVNVGDKATTDRVARARASIELLASTRDALFDGSLPKGDALATVRIAAIQGAKRTADLIPLCHPLSIDGIDVDIEPTDAGASIEVEVRVAGRTGVEMEAMTGAAIGALTMYDMVKGVDRGARVHVVELLTKSGGASGEWHRE
ncbi:MAG: cyclic pyranopterin monophosphate synthase MoaC [Acidimicrobiia bacterium]